MEYIKKIKEIIKYGIGGIISTIVNFWFFYLFTEWNLNYLISNFISYWLAVFLSYYINLYFVFNKIENKENGKRKILKYIIIRVVSIIFDSCLLYMMVTILKGNMFISKVIVSMFIILLTYILNKKYIFHS